MSVSKTKRTIWAAAAMLPWLALVGPAAAQERLPGEAETREVTVTATRTEKDLMEVPMSVGVISEENMKRDPKTSVADILETMPGVTVQDGSMAGGKRVLIRGESPNRALILIDGVKISEQKSMSGSAILMDSSQIERIEVIKGPASVLYGPEAIAGVINIITKKGGAKPFGFSQRFILDSSNNSFTSQSAVFGAHNGFNYRFSAGGTEANERRTPEGTLANTSYDNRNYSGRLGYDWENGGFYVKVDRYESTLALPGVSVPVVGPMGRPMGLDLAMGLPQWDRETVSAGLELNRLTEYLAKLKLSLYRQNMKKDFWNDMRSTFPDAAGQYWTIPGRLPAFVNNSLYTGTFNDQDSLGGTIQSEWILGRSHYLIAGLDYNKDDLDATDTRRGLRTYTSIMTGAPVGPPVNLDGLYNYSAEQSTLGLFAQDEWTIADGWTATLGLRETWVESELTANNNPLLNSAGARKDSRLVGNVGLVYSGVENLSLRAMWSQGYRFPVLNQLYLGTVHGDSEPTYPNPDLAPETSNNYEIGARFNDGVWDVDFALFYSDAKNYITDEALPGGAGRRFVNMDKARTYGAELGLSHTFLDCGLTPYTTVTWLNRTYTQADGQKTDQTATPSFSGRTGLKWATDVASGPDQVFYADLYLNWAVSAEELSGQEVMEHEAWQTLNLTLGTEWGGERKWNASLALRNIGDQAYAQARNTLADPGFHVILGVGFEY
ncbi:MAG: TonB-dependent receptor [Candidatus Adiutrix sp.]|jgi:hemoglobin/transferrin/lactoferrin receptor protein|nr:TonB-dependent receptor [Candidatus Adiutrix sp.]